MGRLRRLALASLATLLLGSVAGDRIPLDFGEKPEGWYEGSGIAVSSVKGELYEGRLEARVDFDSPEDAVRYRELLIEDTSKRGMDYSEEGNIVTLRQDGRTATYTFSDKAVEVSLTSD